MISQCPPRRRTIALVRLVALLLSMLPAVVPALSDDVDAQVVGRWLTQDREGIIEISAGADGTYEGRIASTLETAQTSSQADGEDASLSLRGLKILTGFRYGGEGRYVDGHIYDPRSGQTYKATLSLKGPDVLELRGYIGLPLLGRSTVWTRVVEESQAAR